MNLISPARMFLASTAAALVIVGLPGMAAAASAATAAPAHASQAAVAAAIQAPGTGAGAKTCPIEITRFRTYDRNCAVLSSHLCFVGNEGNLIWHQSIPG